MRPEVEQALTAFKTGRVEEGITLLERTVLSFGMKVCGHREDAEDTAQEVLLKLLPYISRFDSPQAFSVWLYRVARNRCLMSRRQSKFAPKQHLALEELMPTGEELAALAAPAHASPEQSVLRKETADHVRDALERIPPQYRLILVLHDMEELETDVIAELTRLREGTVRVRLHRARLALRKALSNQQRTKAKSNSGTPKRPRHCKQIFAALSEYLDQTLDPEMCNELEKHLSGCQPCEAFLADLEKTVDRCRTFDPSCKPLKKKMRDTVLQEYQRVLTNLQSLTAARS